MRAEKAVSSNNSLSGSGRFSEKASLRLNRMELTCLEVAPGYSVVECVHEVSFGLLEALLLVHGLDDVPGFLDDIRLNGIFRILHSIIL